MAQTFDEFKNAPPGGDTSWMSFGDFSSFASAGMSIWQGMQAKRAGKEEKKFFYEQAAEIERQMKFYQRESRIEAGEVVEERGRAIGTAEAQRAKAGLRGGGSVATRRKIIASKYNKIIAKIGRESVERSRQMGFKAGMLTKRGREAERAGKWKMYSSIIGGVFQSGKELESSGFFNRA
jgi:hypothetical protein